MVVLKRANGKKILKIEGFEPCEKLKKFSNDYYEKMHSRKLNENDQNQELRKKAFLQKISEYMKSQLKVTKHKRFNWLEVLYLLRPFIYLVLVV